MTTPYLIDLPNYSDHRGGLGFVQSQTDIPFDIKRIYYLYDVPKGMERGAHGHKELQQVIIALHGTFDIVLDNGCQTFSFTLNQPSVGLYVPKMMWRDLKNFSTNSVCLVLASDFYKESDYYREYQTFLVDALIDKK